MIPTVDAENSLTAIKTYSLFHSEAELLSQFKQHFKKSGTGTHIIIYNLRQTIDGHLEFDLATDITDIMIPDDAHHSSAKGKYKKQDREDWHPAMDYSLRVQIYIYIYTVGPQRYEHLGKLGVRNCEMFISLKFVISMIT